MLILYCIYDQNRISSRREEIWLSELSTGKAEQIKRLKISHKRHLSLLGLQLLKHGAKMLGMQAFALSGVQFPAGGKPVCPWFDFSISHSENIAVCAISPNQVVGIDIEHIRAINSAIFKRHLTAEERTQSQANPARFFTYWTQKEAIVKAADCGGIVAIPEVVLSRDHGTLRGRIWYTQQVELQENYVVCLALEQQVKSVQCTQIDIDTLTE